MFVQTDRHVHVGPAVQPARCRPRIPDTPGSALGQKPGWWCDGPGMLWENYKAEGKTAVERGQYDKAENFFHAAIEQVEQVGSLNPCLADCLNELAILYAKQHKYAQAELLFQRSLGVSVAALGSDHPDVAIVLKNIGILKASQRQYAEADLLLSLSFSLTNRVLGHEHPIVAVTMRTIDVFQAIQGHLGRPSGSFVVRLRSARKPLDRHILRWLQAGRCLLRSSTRAIEIPRLIGQSHRPRILEPDLHRATQRILAGPAVEE